MNMETVYIETSIFSYLLARQSRNLIAAARQQLTIEWWECHRHRYQHFISNVVIAEASQGDEIRSQERLDLLKDIQRLEITDDCKNLTEKIIYDVPMPEKAIDDAMHAAISSYYSLDFLLTWNCRHLANAHIIPKLRSVVESEGFQFPQICTPEELMGEL